MNYHFSVGHLIWPFIFIDVLIKTGSKPRFNNANFVNFKCGVMLYATNCWELNYVM